MPQSKQWRWPKILRGRRAFVTMDVAIVTALAVFAVDILTNLHGAIAVLYITIPLLLASAYSERVVISSSAICAILATIAFLRQHLGEEIDSAYTRFGVSMAALAVTTFLAIRQKRSAAEQQRSERRYRAIFHAAGFAAWESDWSQVREHVMRSTAQASGEIEAWLMQHPKIIREGARLASIQVANQAAISLFEARSAEDIIRRSLVGRYPRGSGQGFAHIIAELLKGKEMVEAEVPLRTVQGRRLDVILRVTLVQDGEPWSRALVMAFDETERKEARAKLEQASAELAHAARISVLGQLAASIAHEVNQPLTAIVAYGKSANRWLDREPPNVNEARDCLGEIVSNSSRAAEVIARVRSLARKAPPKVERLILSEVIEEAVALVGHVAKSADTGIRVELGETAKALGDRVQVQQVLVNLLLNGIQAVESTNRQDPEIVLALSIQEGMARVDVRDCGTGIQDLDAIFTPFFTTKQDGMGMGLSICRSILEAQGGRISAQNNPDVGATVSFTLPLEEAEPACAEPTQTSV